MKRLAGALAALILATLTACGALDTEPDAGAEVTPVFGIEITPASGRMTGPTYQLDVQVGRGPQSTPAQSEGHVLDPATPIRTN